MILELVVGIVAYLVGVFYIGCCVGTIIRNASQRGAR
jgi:hypothetical protein